MLSTKYLPQPYPNYPALCRQDTTYAWSHDNGGNHLRSAWTIWKGCATLQVMMMMTTIMTMTMMVMLVVMMMVG